MITSDDELKELSAKIRSVDNKEERDKLKAQILPAVTFSGSFKSQGKNFLSNYTGFIVLDFDHIDEPNKLRQVLIQDPKLPILMAFISPSGNGLKVVVKALNFERHTPYFEAISDYIKQEYHINTDRSGKDVSRLCFLCHDDTAYFNDNWENDDRAETFWNDYTEAKIDSIFGGGDTFENAWKKIKDTTPPIPTGFSQLDKLMGGGLIPGVYCFGGSPSTGKTTFAHQIIINLLTRRMPVIYFSLELEEHEVFARIMSNLSAQIARDKLRHSNQKYHSLTHFDIITSQGQIIGDPEIYQLAFERMMQLKKRLRLYSGKLSRDDLQNADSLRIFQQYQKALGQRFNVKSIELAVKDVMTQLDSLSRTDIKPVVFIDYLQKIQGEDGKQTDKMRNDMNIFGVKDLSKQLGIPIVLVSTLSREGYYSHFDMSAVKETGGIEYECDFLAGFQLTALERNTERLSEQKAKEIAREHRARDPRWVSLVVTKNRNGRTDELIDFEYYPAQNLFFEYCNTVNENNCVHQYHSNLNLTPGDIEQNDNKIFGRLQTQTNQPTQTAPTLRQICDFTKNIKYRKEDNTESEWQSDITKFYEYHTKTGWKEKNGKPSIWQNDLVGWEKNYREKHKNDLPF